MEVGKVRRAAALIAAIGLGVGAVSVGAVTLAEQRMAALTENPRVERAVNLETVLTSTAVSSTPRREYRGAVREQTALLRDADLVAKYRSYHFWEGFSAVANAASAVGGALFGLGLMLRTLVRDEQDRYELEELAVWATPKARSFCEYLREIPKDLRRLCR